MPWPISALPYPFELGFMQRALVAGVAVGVFAPMIGTFLVQKRMSLIGDGIGHVAFAGVGAGLIAGIWPIWTALAFAVGGALGIEWLRSRRKASGDLALALFFYSGIALGVVLVSLGGGLEREPADVPVRPAAHRERQRARGDRDPGVRDRPVDAGAPPRVVRGRDGRGLVACLGSARRVREQRARGVDGRGRRRRHADRRHPADRRDDGAAGGERPAPGAVVPFHAPMVDRGQRVLGDRGLGRVEDLGNGAGRHDRPASRRRCSRSSRWPGGAWSRRLPATEGADL